MRSYAALVLVGIGLGLCAKPPSANTLIALLEQHFPRADIGNGEGVAGVIALPQAARLAQLYRHLQVVVTGAGRRAEVLSDRAAR